MPLAFRAAQKGAGRGRIPPGKSRRGSLPIARARPRTPGPEQPIQNLQSEYCDDFVCTSSPQVEQSLRAFARDIERGSQWTLSIFSRDVVFGESLLGGFQGRDGYRANTWNQDNLEAYRASVSDIRMVEHDRAEVEWKFSGELAGGQLDAQVTSCLVLNTVTGQIEEHRNRTQLSGNPLAVAVYFAQKFTWARQEDASRLRQRVNGALDNWSNGGDQFVQDPMDRMKFTQQVDTTFNDAVQWALFLLIMWTLVRAYQSLDGF